MKYNKIILAFIVVIGLMVFVIPRIEMQDAKTKTTSETVCETDIATITPIDTHLVKDENKIVAYKNANEKYDQKLDELKACSDTMQWFTEYKQIIYKYGEYIDEPTTLYDNFTQEEITLLFQIVEAEVTGDDHFHSKVNVASVIFNRLNNERFSDNLTDILTQEYQFSSYHDGRYGRVVITNTTILACEYAFTFGDSTSGALYFDSCNGKSWASKNRTYIFTDDVGHDFYR